MTCSGSPQSCATHSEFLATEHGRLFATLHAPVGRCQDCVLVVPPFAEEMNKTRRLVSELCRMLARRGIAAALADLYGTGDSEGGFEDATWAVWLDNLLQTSRWLESQGFVVNGLLAIRLGAALAYDAVRAGKIRPVQRTVLCQPVFDGRRHLQQFLRLRVAAGRMAGDSRETLDSLQTRLSSGFMVEVAGYPLSPVLAGELERVGLPESLSEAFGEVEWVEIARSADAGVSAQAQRYIERSATTRFQARAHAVVCEPFWGATEIVVDPGLLSILSDCLAGRGLPVGARQC